MRSEVERLEGELRAVQEGDAQAGPDSEEAAERNAAALASALQERDEAWTMRMREAEVEWKAQLGVVEARWQGRFARMEELIRVCALSSSCMLMRTLAWQATQDRGVN